MAERDDHDAYEHIVNQIRRQNASGKDWHLDKKVSVSVIGMLAINMIGTVFGFVWTFATLTKDVTSLKERPDLTERVIRLEAISDEHGRTMQEISAVLSRLDRTIREIANEQNRRSGVIDWARQQQNHGRGQ